MLDVALRHADGTTSVDWQQVGPRTVPPLPVHPALHTILPHGLRRGSTVAVTGSVSLLLALVGTASAEGAWCALVGFPKVSAESADEYGVDLRRLAVVPSAGTTAATWTTAVGALLDAVDIVAARPPRLVPGDVRRLAARARSRDAVLMPYGDWPGADVRVRAAHGTWDGIGPGTGRLQARRITVDTDGKGQAARPRHADLWLPARGGGIESVVPLAPVVDLAG